MKLNKSDVMTILKILKHQWDTMLDMEEQNYENNKQKPWGQGFHLMFQFGDDFLSVFAVDFKLLTLK